MNKYLEAAQRRTVEALLKARATPEQQEQYAAQNGDLKAQVALLAAALDSANARIENLEAERQAGWNAKQSSIEWEVDQILESIGRDALWSAFDDAIEKYRSER